MSLPPRKSFRQRDARHRLDNDTKSPQGNKSGYVVIALAVCFIFSLCISIYCHTTSDDDLLLQWDGIIAPGVWHAWRDGRRVGPYTTEEFYSKGRKYQDKIDTHHTMRAVSTGIAVLSLAGIVAMVLAAMSKKHQAATKTCMMCCKRIALAAKKCPHCQSLVDGPAVAEPRSEHPTGNGSVSPDVAQHDAISTDRIQRSDQRLKPKHRPSSPPRLRR